MAVWEHTK